MNKIRIFAGYYRPHARLFALDMACAFGIAAIDLAFPLVSRHALQVLVPDKAWAPFAWLVALCFAGFGVRSILQYIVTFWGHTLGVRMETDIRRDLFSHLQKLSFSFYDRTRTGHLMSRAVGDLFEIVELAHHGPEDLFISFLTLIGSFIAMALIRWEFALSLGVVVPVIIVFTARRRKLLADASVEVKRKTAGINANLESSISGVRVTKAFANEAYEIEKFDDGNRQYKAAKGEYYRSMGVFHGGMEFALSTLNVLSIGVGGALVMSGRMGYADLVAFTLYVATFLSPIKRLVSFFEQYTTGMAGFQRFVELMGVEPEPADRPGAKSLDAVLSLAGRETAGADTRGVQGAAIEFRDVSFAYSGGANVLSGVNLRIDAGKTVAIVGPSGSGKTTMSRLIPRFYELSSGSITVDGIDVRDLKLASLREHIGMVQQDVFLFADSIRENIRYGKLDATDAEIEAAAKRAHIHDFILSQPEGYATQVGERGVLLSGGQKQRISIARIFLKNPPVLILDEATSALDSTTERFIQKSLEELSKGRTSVVIAHRLSTISGADEIVYLESGEIAERGSHEELMRLDGRYAALYRSQFSETLDDTAF